MEHISEPQIQVLPLFEETQHHELWNILVVWDSYKLTILRAAACPNFQDATKCKASLMYTQHHRGEPSYRTYFVAHCAVRVIPHRSRRACMARKTQLLASTVNGTDNSTSIAYQFCAQVSSWLIRSAVSTIDRLCLSCVRNFTVLARAISLLLSSAASREIHSRTGVTYEAVMVCLTTCPFVYPHLRS